MTTRVLIVDDDPAIRFLIKAFLDSERSFDVVGEATNASDGLEMAAKLKPDLVTMDYQMPGEENGAACIRSLKERWPDIHILALTSSGSDATEEMLEAGAYAAIDKAHMELVIPALYKIADAVSDAEAAAHVASQWDQLREVIAEMDSGAARMLAAQKRNLSDRLELMVVLKAVLVTLRNPRYSVAAANELAAGLVLAVLQSDDEVDVA